MDTSTSSDTCYIPIIDFGCLGLDKDDVDYTDEAVICTANELTDAFRTIGFAYLKNHGLTEQQISDVQQLSNRFFSLPQATKDKYAKEVGGMFGYIAMGMESASQKGHPDIKETVSITYNPDQKLPSEDDVPGFKAGVLDMLQAAYKLTKRILRALTIGLKLKDWTLFDSCHNLHDNNRTNVSNIRLARYPPIGDTVIEPGQTRCGEHSDFGTLTLVFQDTASGLEVQDLNGDYKPATPIPGTIVVNIADALQRWTSDVLRSTRHRVVIPDDEIAREQARTSIIFFLVADNEALIECVDGSNKYPPITCIDYIRENMAAIFHEDK